jgi:hypothetical protein
VTDETQAQESSEAPDVAAEGAEGDTFVPLSPKPPAPGPTEPSDAVNLVPLLRDMLDKKGKPLLESMAETCIEDYDADVRSRRDRMKKIDEYEKLFASVMKAKNFPFNNAAVVNLPFLPYVALQTHARLFDMVVPATGKIIYCSPTNLADVERAGMCEKFGNSYLRYRMSDFATGMDVTLLQMCKAGSAFRRTYWNEYAGKVCSDSIPMADFVVAYWQKCDDPSLRGVPRYTLVQHLTYFDLEDYAADGIYENVDKIEPDDADEQQRDDAGLRETVKKEDGVSPASETTADDKPRMVLDQHRRWRMPNKPGVHPSFDGRSHFVIVTIDEKSRQVLRVVVREEDDPADLGRFQREDDAYTQHTQATQAFVAATEAHGDATNMAMVQGLPPPDAPLPPEPPPGLKTDADGVPVPPKPCRQREITFFTHYKCFPGEGFYGLGFGDFIAPLNKAANTLLNQHIDGVTLRNARPGFISRQLRGARGAVSVQPGQLEEVDAPLGVLKDGIVWLDPPQSDPTTMPLLELLQSMVEKFGGSDILSGEVPKSNNTATGMSILNEQAMAPITVLSRRVKEAEKAELDKIWRCWGTFLPDEEIADIIDENGSPSQVTIGRSMFRPDAHVMPVSDPRMKSQKVQETQAVYSLITSNPMTANNPAAVQMATEDVLRAMDANKMIPVIQPPPQPGPPPPRPHWQEDADYLRGQDSAVNPQDDDAAHIKGHLGFKNTPAGQAMDPTQAKMHEQHIRGHMAQQLDKAGADLQNMLAMGVGPAPEQAPAPVPQ